MPTRIITKIQTLSLAFVMGAMLGVGIGFIPQTASAQEATSEQRVAMLEQINMLMQLITQLMAQLQTIQAVEQSASTLESNENNAIDGLTVRPARGNAPLEVMFEFKMNTEKTCDNHGYQIDFGDGSMMAFSKNSSNLFNFNSCDSYIYPIEHTYKQAGTYTATISKCLSEVPKGETCPLLKLETQTVKVTNEKLKEDVNLKPEIKLISPNGHQVFDKSVRNDDVVIKWEAEDVPDNTNVIIEIELVEAYAGTAIGGGSSQVLAKEGVQEQREAIDIEGTMGAGEYKVRVSLEECHSRGCNMSYSFGPLKENLKVYDRSSYEYFTVIDSELANVRLKVSGYGDSKEIDLDVDDAITVSHYPVGDIDKCTITGQFENGNYTETSSWPNTIKSGQYGRTTFSAISSNGALQEVRVECEDEDRRLVAQDSIKFNVDQGDTGSYKITLNGETIDEAEGVSEAAAQSACVVAYHDYETYNFSYRDVLKCEWNGEVFKTVDAWKG